MPTTVLTIGPPAPEPRPELLAGEATRVYAFYEAPPRQNVNGGIQLTAKGAVVLGVATRF